MQQNFDAAATMERQVEYESVQNEDGLKPIVFTNGGLTHAYQSPSNPKGII